MDPMKTVEHYGWYIINALRFKCDSLEKAIKESKETLKDRIERPEVAKLAPALYDSLEGMVEHCEQSLKEHREALDAMIKLDI